MLARLKQETLQTCNLAHQQKYAQGQIRLKRQSLDQDSFYIFALNKYSSFIASFHITYKLATRYKSHPTSYGKIRKSILKQEPLQQS